MTHYNDIIMRRLNDIRNAQERSADAQERIAEAVEILAAAVVDMDESDDRPD